MKTSLEQAEREYYKFLQKKVRESKQAAVAEVAASTAAAAAATAAPAATPVAEEVAASKKRGRKPKQSADSEAVRHIVEGMRP